MIESSIPSRLEQLDVHAVRPGPLVRVSAWIELVAGAILLGATVFVGGVVANVPVDVALAALLIVTGHRQLWQLTWDDDGLVHRRLFGRSVRLGPDVGVVARDRRVAIITGDGRSFVGGTYGQVEYQSADGQWRSDWSHVPPRDRPGSEPA